MIVDPVQEMRSLVKLRARRDTMIDYLLLRAAMRDWHGVMDAAADIREIEAQIGLLEGTAR